ncbi:MAG: hypothetical protein KGQ41_01960 [Alphaproteobacteria bacterium]|nr:hypothetical protein [Alphaproteobacteria bacterium]
MIHSINTIGHKVSAVAGSLIHSRDQKTARMRVFAAGSLMAAVFLVSTSNIALAGQDLSGYAQTVTRKTSAVVDVVAYVSYIGGAILSALGIVDLKKHVEQPTQVPLKNGLAKLGFGGVLLGLPFVSGVMLETMKGNGQQAQYQDFQTQQMTIRGD